MCGLTSFYQNSMLLFSVLFCFLADSYFLLMPRLFLEYGNFLEEPVIEARNSIIVFRFWRRLWLWILLKFSLSKYFSQILGSIFKTGLLTGLAVICSEFSKFTRHWFCWQKWGMRSEFHWFLPSPAAPLKVCSGVFGKGRSRRGEGRNLQKQSPSTNGRPPIYRKPI